MSILLDIQNDAVDGSVSLATLLRKIRLLAARLNSGELEDWVRFEMDGYPNGTEVPKYRQIPLSFKGTFSGPFGTGGKGLPIPQHLVKKYSKRDDIDVFRCRQSIASIEASLSATEGSFQLNMDNVGLLLQGNVYEDWAVIAFWAEFPASTLENVKNAVRNRVLELAIELWKQNPEAGSLADEGKQISGAQVSQIFHTTVYGSANVVGTANHSTFNITNEPGDWAALRKILEDAKVEQQDIAELQTAIAQDPKPAKGASGFGPAVTKWSKKMLGKAAEGVWSIGIAAGGKVVEEGLLRYYGL